MSTPYQDPMAAALSGKTPAAQQPPEDPAIERQRTAIYLRAFAVLFQVLAVLSGVGWGLAILFTMISWAASEETSGAGFPWIYAVLAVCSVLSLLWMRLISLGTAGLLDVSAKPAPAP